MLTGGSYSRPARTSTEAEARSFGLGPDSGRLTVAEEFQVNHVGVAADGAVLDVLLLGAAGGIPRDDDPLATGGTDVRPLRRSGGGGSASCFASSCAGEFIPRS
jgi:hypothetical protein